MAQVVWTDSTLSDLNDIAEYIALDNLPAAKLVVQSVFDKVERLETFPESGRVPHELPHLNYREVVVSPCRVFYKQEADTVFILYVMREERELRKFLLSK
ncbi:plasmid stabilization protein [Enterovibrio norvegicus]|uniref:Toxin ParE1/3/4 n=2 Tax=Enterovibrio norvegicus TaxID=188144 RepID=A0A1I5KFV3_9GAMM|nr:type II toxin-antitoxin system RelE/ParE family toxin [Enterovibrio norvegicus]OEF49314.1 plasmid stabilization protein [Enterovibrio norvegicus]OEF55981.1 plasmid stabilization protein [Enterovibrio norvegicus]SFO83837.1 toxin ParE1/3/4 [Enterovibrio norvegicus DSM 15893]